MCVFGFYGVAIVGALAIGHLVQKSRGEQLRRLARRLEDGRASVPQGFFGSISEARVTGRLGGLPVQLSFQTRGSGKQKRIVALYRVRLEDGAGQVTVRRADILTKVARWFGLGDPTTGDEELDRQFSIRGSQAALRQLRRGQEGQGAQIRHLLQRSFDRHRLDQVALSSFAVDAEHNARWDAAGMEDIFRTLVDLARAWGRQKVEIKLKGAITVRPHMAWTGGGNQPLCPFCRDELGGEGEALEACPRCDTVHHAACLEEAGGCTVFGCGTRGSTRRQPQRG